MNQIEELKSVGKIIQKYNLPMSPILEYAINEKCEALESYSIAQENFSEIYNYIKTFKEMNGGRKQCPLPSDLRKLLIMKRTEVSETFNLLIEAC